MIKKPFVLSGGGARGAAHLGVVKALQEYNIIPSEISGTSSGAVVGAFLASGFSPEEIKELFVGKFKINLLSWNAFRMGLVSLKNIKRLLEQNLRYKDFDQLHIPFYATATNFVDGRQVIFKEGNLVDALLAACSIPVLFPPVFINDIPYVDGGLSNNLPIEPFQLKKGEIISIYVNPIKQFQLQKGVVEMIDRSWHLSFREMVSRSSEGCFMYIEPQPLQQFGVFDFHKLPDIFEVGYSFTKELMKKGNF
jgi:NTE family protein